MVYTSSLVSAPSDLANDFWQCHESTCTSGRPIWIPWRLSRSHPCTACAAGGHLDQVPSERLDRLLEVISLAYLRVRRSRQHRGLDQGAPSVAAQCHPDAALPHGNRGDPGAAVVAGDQAGLPSMKLASRRSKASFAGDLSVLGAARTRKGSAGIVRGSELCSYLGLTPEITAIELLAHLNIAPVAMRLRRGSMKHSSASATFVFTFRRPLRLGMMWIQSSRHSSSCRYVRSIPLSVLV